MGRLWSDLGPIKITVQSWGATRAHLLYVHFPHRHLSFKGCGCGGRYIENPAYGKKRKVVSLPYFSRSTVCLMVVLCKSGESLEKSWSGLGQNITLRSLAFFSESFEKSFSPSEGSISGTSFHRAWSWAFPHCRHPGTQWSMLAHQVRRWKDNQVDNND